jgi:hypothetical protein
MFGNGVPSEPLRSRKGAYKSSPLMSKDQSKLRDKTTSISIVLLGILEIFPILEKNGFVIKATPHIGLRKDL